MIALVTVLVGFGVYNYGKQRFVGWFMIDTWLGWDLCWSDGVMTGGEEGAQLSCSVTVSVR